ncbi:uncharacterized protein FIBRA_02783 [Fibroporia radiculosa]|uniref:Uncharacterized protein n=1 Tax=Fibroporia radiculosa TaxID=599839 RepID=J4G2R2_9APHY|nr:uncharacterized protein FIBRA_02783 [Fibroporia radiculosa]CCM00743.1 predicted protein [Fibroporia radiculosa]
MNSRAMVPNRHLSQREFAAADVDPGDERDDRVIVLTLGRGAPVVSHVERERMIMMRRPSGALCLAQVCPAPRRTNTRNSSSTAIADTAPHVANLSPGSGLSPPPATTYSSDFVHGTDVPAHSESNLGMWPAYPQPAPVAGHWQHSASYNVPPAYPGVPGGVGPLYGETSHYPASGPLYHHPGLGTAPQANHMQWPTSVPSGGPIRTYYPGAMHDTWMANSSQQTYPTPSSFVADPNELRWDHTDRPVPDRSTFSYHHPGGLVPNPSSPPSTFPTSPQGAEQYEPEPETTEETGGYDPHNWDYPYSVPKDGGDGHW